MQAIGTPMHTYAHQNITRLFRAQPRFIGLTWLQRRFDYNLFRMQSVSPSTRPSNNYRNLGLT